jgi:hypothetical protein
MKFLKSLLMGTGAVVLAGLVLALFDPKAVHAIAATAVQVVNTASSPVFNRDVDNPARTPYTDACTVTPPVQTCTITVPAGQRFVIEQFTAVQQLTVGRLGYVSVAALTSGQDSPHNFTPTTTFNYRGFSSVIPDTPTHINADPGSALSVSFYDVDYSQPLYALANVSGYLITP